MRLDQLEHIVRAAGTVLNTTEVVVFGSQAILASVPAPPPAAVRSLESDIAALGDEDGHLADLIDGNLGEASPFHEQFGIYAEGVTFDTVVVPDGWWGRTIKLHTPNTGGVTAYCLEAHDLVLSKLRAGREKDMVFCRELIGTGIVDVDTLGTRIPDMPGDEKAHQGLRDAVRRCATPVDQPVLGSAPDVAEVVIDPTPGNDSPAPDK